MSQENTTALAAKLPESMLNRGGMEKRENVMESIHSLKVYNAQPGKSIDPELSFQLMIKNNTTDGKYIPYGKSVEVNILKVRKGINGMFNLLDENDNVVKEGNEVKKGFAYSEEYGRYTKNIDQVYFKSNDINMLSKTELGKLKQALRTQLLPNGRKNPFFKVALDQNGIPYNSSFLSESYIIYGVFKTGEYAGEPFRLFMSSSAFGQNWDKDTRVTTLVPGSLAEALSKVSEEFKASGIQGYCDDSLTHATLTVEQSGNFFKPKFIDPRLVDYDNTEDFNNCEELLAMYKEQEFGASGVEKNQILDGRQLPGTEVSSTPTQSNQGYYKPTVEQTEPVETKVEQVSNQNISKQEPTSKHDEGISIEDIPF